MLEGDEDDIIFYVDLDYDKYEDEWDDLTNTEIKRFMSDIYDDIEDVFEDAEIEGFVYDISNGDVLFEY